MLVKQAFSFYLALVELGFEREYAKFRAVALLRSKRASEAALKLDTLCRGGQI